MRDRRSLLNMPFNVVRTTLLVGSGGLAILFVFLLMNVWQFSWDWLQGDRWRLVKNKPPEVMPSAMIIEKIQGVSELTTTVFSMETVVPATQERQLAGVVIGQSRLLYVAYGEVRAGIDLNELTTEDIQTTGDRLVVTLPEPQILDKKIDVERSQIYDYDQGFLNLGPDTMPELLEFAQRNTINKLLLNACDHGILQKANDQAEIALGSLLSNTGFESVEIQTTKATMCAGTPAE